MAARPSALHDIGKISIPESILNKPGRLTKDEFEIMKTHTTIGADILDKLPFQQKSELVRTAYASAVGITSGGTAAATPTG